MIKRVREITGQSGLLYVGDCKMVPPCGTHGDFYLMPLPLTQETAEQFDAWRDAVIDGQQVAELIWHEDQP